MNDEMKIIVIDDSPMDIELATEALQEINIDNEIITFIDSEAALDYLMDIRDKITEVNDILFILLDLKMPKISGLEALKVIKTDKSLKAVPVIILTSSREEKDLIECYRHGANSFLVKPIAYSDFVEKMTTLANYWLFVNEALPKTQFGK